MPTPKPPNTPTDTRALREQLDEAQERRSAIEETAGLLTGVYPPGELERLRKDWPE